MNIISSLVREIITIIKTTYNLSLDEIRTIETTLQVGKETTFGDISCNAAMVLARRLKQRPRDLADRLKENFEQTMQENKTSTLATAVERIEIAGPGFLNFFLRPTTWQTVALQLHEQKKTFFKPDITKGKKRYLIEFVSANPTGPLHFGHGRGGIIGDVLANILQFLGHEAVREFYVNDAGVQIKKLGNSLKIRCQQLHNPTIEFAQDGYHGKYLIELAQQCVQEHGKQVVEKDIDFFSCYALDNLLKQIKATLTSYGIYFSSWFYEKTLHKDGSIERVLGILRTKNLLYTKENALWFRSSNFGDDKDRVIKKADDSYTYIAADIAYHKHKFDRKFDYLIDILGQDHHGYVKRLKATMQALDYPADNLHVILYQLVSIKHAGQAQKMSKRSGTFTKLQDIIDTVGTDVARFFYLNRKAEAHLDFDLAVALKKTEENPVYYIHYAYVRTKSILQKADEHEELRLFLQSIANNKKDEIKQATEHMNKADHTILKKIISLDSLLHSIERTHGTHQLAYYSIELAQFFHHYYAHNKIIDPSTITTSKARLLLTTIIRDTLELCLDLMGLTKPEKM